MATKKTKGDLAVNSFVSHLERCIRTAARRNNKDAATAWSPKDDVCVYWIATPPRPDDVDKELKIVLRAKGGKVALRWHLSIAQGRVLSRQLAAALEDIDEVQTEHR